MLSLVSTLAWPSDFSWIDLDALKLCSYLRAKAR